MKLTTAIARNLEPEGGKDDEIIWDDDFPGFGVRLRVGRKRISRMWVFQYDFAGHTRRHTIGNVMAIGIEDARKTAGKLQSNVRLGHDPVTEKAENLARAANTFASVMETYLSTIKLRLREATVRVSEHHLRLTAEPLHPLPFVTITRREIAALLTPIAARGKPQMYNNTRNKLSALFNWAVSQGIIEHNPVVGTPRYPKSKRDRCCRCPNWLPFGTPVTTSLFPFAACPTSPTSSA